MISFIVPGAPVGKGRPRFAKRGNFVSTYTPEKTASYENLVKLYAGQAMAGIKTLYNGPLVVLFDVCVPVPASWSKKNKAAALNQDLRPTTKPDADNIAKLLCDAMNGVVYTDDKLIVELMVRKWYSETPCVEVTVKEC